METFFVSCPVRFEQELMRELESFWFQLMDLDGLPTRAAFPEVNIETGGIEFQAPMHLGLQVNFFTRIGLRVLLRVNRFEARYFDLLEKELKKMQLSRYVNPQPMNILIESSQSRLFHEKNLLECVSKVLSQQKYSYDKNAVVSLYIRVFKDKVTVSLDTSGEHLHFRGYRKHQGEAPLRENLASLVLELAKIDVYQEQILLDPYCGSGTFFFEAWLKGMPNFAREYSFLTFKTTPAIFKSETWKKNYRWVDYNKKIICIGFDKNAETHKKAIMNQHFFNENYFPTNISFKKLDSEASDINQELLDSSFPVTIITNPPYGERSAAGAVVSFIERLEGIKNLEQIVVIHPESWRFKFKKMRQASIFSLSNQGIKTVVSVFKTRDNQEKSV